MDDLPPPDALTDSRRMVACRKMPPVSRTCRCTARRTLLAAAALLAALALGGCSAVGGSPATTRVTAKDSAEGVSFTEGALPVLFYRAQPAPGREPWRRHYLHPVRALDGAILTEDAPADHVHQRGIYWAWRRILVDGVHVADGWVGKGLTLSLAEPRLRPHVDGSAEMQVHGRWSVPLHGASVEIIEEFSSIRVHPVRDGVRRLDLAVQLRALRPGVALAGTDDDKGYGGISFRLRDAPAVLLESGGQQLRAATARMPTGESVAFAWPATSALGASKLEVSCTVDGRPWTEWVLRQEPSMQNCAFPGRSPVTLDGREWTHLAATVWIR
jgi:hypothetical protein